MKRKLFRIIFFHDTKAGRQFDVALLWLILASVTVVILESIPDLQCQYFSFFYAIEWVFTVLFTIEYLLRIWSSPKPLKYIFSFWGLIDLLAILPSFLDYFFKGVHYLHTVRIFRLLRVFRILKLVKFNKEAQILLAAIKQSSHKIAVFMMAVLTIVTIMGTLMYVVEGPENGFDSIPQSIYWAIVTVTTVGFGDIVPQTIVGKFLASFSMILGYAIIAVPTGIITVELSRKTMISKDCNECGEQMPDDAGFCSKCGNKLE